MNLTMLLHACKYGCVIYACTFVHTHTFKTVSVLILYANFMCCAGEDIPY